MRHIRKKFPPDAGPGELVAGRVGLDDTRTWAALRPTATRAGDAFNAQALEASPVV